MIAAAITSYRDHAVLANGDKWGVPVAFATPESKQYAVRCTRYCDAPMVKFRIPPGTVPAAGSDHHLAVIDFGHGGARELDLWKASYDAATDSWSAQTVVVNAVRGSGASCPEHRHCNGAVAAGFALLGGVVWPHELKSGHIDHALALTTPLTRRAEIACPATHTDGKTDLPGAIPEGARLQLDPLFDVDAQPWPAWKKTIAKALQRYGAYVVDTSGALAIRGVSDINLRDNRWADSGTPTQASLSDLPWEHMRVLLLRSCN